MVCPAVTRMAANEVIPGKLYQRAHFLTWTAGQKQALLERLGVTVVVNLWLKVDPDLSGQCIYLNWPIAGNRVPPDTKAMTNLVNHLLDTGHVVLVHCEAGRNRSAWFCARLAAMRGVGSVPALERIPGAKLRPELLKDLFA